MHKSRAKNRSLYSPTLPSFSLRAPPLLLLSPFTCWPSAPPPAGPRPPRPRRRPRRGVAPLALLLPRPRAGPPPRPPPPPPPPSGAASARPAALRQVSYMVGLGEEGPHCGEGPVCDGAMPREKEGADGTRKKKITLSHPFFRRRRPPRFRHLRRRNPAQGGRLAQGPGVGAGGGDVVSRPRERRETQRAAPTSFNLVHIFHFPHKVLDLLPVLPRRRRPAVRPRPPLRARRPQRRS